MGLSNTFGILLSTGDTMGKAKKRIDTKSHVAEQILGILHGGEQSRLERLLGAVVLMNDSGQFKKELKLFYTYIEGLHAENKL
jgi:hypothetical protein